MFELDDLEHQVTHLLPKLTRGGLILALWSTFERSVKDVAERTAQHTGNPKSRKHFRSHFFSATEKAFLASCGMQAFPDANQKLKLEILASVRHTLIHHAGRLEEAPPNISSLDHQALEKVVIRLERDYGYDFIVPTEEFLSEAVDLVYAYVHDLADRAYLVLFPLPSHGR
jgi:hypothetical protein